MLIDELEFRFPIVLSKHRKEWDDQYLLEKMLLENLIDPINIIQIDHIGSTSIPNISAKPSIDILLQINDSTIIENLILIIENAGYIYNIFDEPCEHPLPSMLFVKGYDCDDLECVKFHLHIRYNDNGDDILFRDYLLKYPNVALEYENLKLELAEMFKFDRLIYAQQKKEFINQVKDKARRNVFRKCGGSYIFYPQNKLIKLFLKLFNIMYIIILRFLVILNL